VVGGGIGAWLLAVAFRRIAPSWRTGLMLGGFWLAINLALDLAVLVPFTKMPITPLFHGHRPALSADSDHRHSDGHRGRAIRQAEGLAAARRRSAIVLA